MVERLFLAVPRGCLRFVIVVFPDHTHLLFTRKVTYLSYLILMLDIPKRNKRSHGGHKNGNLKHKSGHALTLSDISFILKTS